MNFQVCFLFLFHSGRGKEWQDEKKSRNILADTHKNSSFPSIVWIIPLVLPFHPPFPVCMPTKGIPAVKDKQEEDPPGPKLGPSSAHVRWVWTDLLSHNWHMTTSTEFIYSFPTPRHMHSWGLYLYMPDNKRINNKRILSSYNCCWSSWYFFYYFKNGGGGHNNSTRSLSLTHQRSPDSTCDFPSARQLHVNNRN